MKVLHVIPSLSAVHGGPTRALALMEQALASHGVSVETATTDDDGPGRRNGKACGQPLQENGVPHWYFAKLLEFYKPSPAFARWIGSEVARYDIVHIHALFSFTSVAAARAARRAGVPYILRPLGTLSDYGMRQRRPWLKSLSLRFVEGPLLRDAAAVHFTSEQEAVEARQLGIPMNEALIPLGVEPGLFAPGTTDGADVARSGTCPHALFLSRLDPKKNVEGLLAALALVKDEFPQLRLVVAGDGTAVYVEALKALARRLQLEDRISWAGHVEGSVKAGLFHQAGFFVLPSFSENFGIAAAEALAAGLPCVLGEGVAIAPHVVSAGAGVAVAPDAASIAEGIRRIMSDPKRLVLMSAHARRLAHERYSTDAMGANLRKLYTDILSR